MTKPVLDQSATEFDKTNLNFLTDFRKSISFIGARASMAQRPKANGDNKTRPPTFYLDTNIMVDASKSRNPKSISLISAIDKNEWKCVASAFAFMEMIDIEQDTEFVKIKHRDGVDYSRICRDRYCRDMSLPDLQNAESTFSSFHQQYPFIRPASLNENGWDLALHITSSSNIFAPDAIHLATAWMHGCDLLITNDAHFVKESKKLLSHENVSCFAVCTAEMAEVTMQELGFEVTM